MIKNKKKVKIILNADDFGISLGTNKAIEKAFKLGSLTSTSIMPTGPAFADAIRIAKKSKRLGVGVHLSLTWGVSVLHKKQIPDLVDNNNYFYPSFLRILLLSTFSSKVREQIKKEFKAQIDAVIKAGVNPDHLNGQIHIHFIPSVFPIVTNLASKYNIKYVRVPQEPFIVVSSFSSLLKWFLLYVLGTILKFQNKLHKNYVVFYGILNTSNMTAQIIKKIIQENKYDRIEILTHPGFHDLTKTDFDYNKQQTSKFLLDNNRLRELKALENRSLITYLHSKKIYLTTFKNL